MIGRILNALSVEIIKAVRTPVTFIAPAAVSLTVLAAPLTHAMAHDGESDYAFLAYAIPLAVNVIGLTLILIYCSGLIAGELASGTIRTVLVRPLLRHEFLLAKFALGAGYAVMNLCLAIVLALFLVVLMGDLNGIQIGGEVIYSNAEMMKALALASALELLPLFAAISMAFLISVSTRSSVLAATLTIAIWLFVELVKYPLHFWRFSFTTYFETPWNIFSEMCDGFSVRYFPELFWMFGATGVAFAIFMGLSFLLMSRRDLTP